MGPGKRGFGPRGSKTQDRAQDDLRPRTNRRKQMRIAGRRRAGSCIAVRTRSAWAILFASCVLPLGLSRKIPPT